MEEDILPALILGFWLDTQGDHCVLYVLYVLYSQIFVLYGTIWQIRYYMYYMSWNFGTIWKFLNIILKINKYDNIVCYNIKIQNKICRNSIYYTCFYYIFVMIIIYSFFDIKIHLLRIKIHPHSYKNHYWVFILYYKNAFKFCF